MNDITALAQRLKAAAEKASNGEWVKESGDGWEATCSANDQANGGFIIAHFEGPDAPANRELVQAASPANVLALVEALEKAHLEISSANRMMKAQDQELITRRQRIASLESRTVTVKLPKLPVLGSNAEWYQGYAAGTSSMRKDCATALSAAGILVIEGEGQ